MALDGIAVSELRAHQPGESIALRNNPIARGKFGLALFLGFEPRVANLVVAVDALRVGVVG